MSWKFYDEPRGKGTPFKLKPDEIGLSIAEVEKRYPAPKIVEEAT
jgi:hypothetical protein